MPGNMSDFKMLISMRLFKNIGLPINLW